MWQRLKILGPPGRTLLVLFLSTACDDPVREQERRDAIRWADTEKPAVSPEFEDEDFSFTAKRPRPCETSGPMAPSAGKKRLSIPITVRGKSARQIPVSALLFTLEDAEGHEVRPTLAGCSPAIPQRRIARDEEVTGEVAFDVPTNFREKELRFEPFLIGREKVIARVLLRSSGDAP
jgi:hypothetical protein